MEKLAFVILMFVVGTIGMRGAEDVEAAWEKYLTEFPMGIQTKAEYGKRKSNFEKIHAIIEEHNADENATYTMAHNQFSIMDSEERKQYLLQNLASTKSLYEELGFEAVEDNDDSTMRQLPQFIDHRKDRCMQPVKNQGGCGSCSAFAATAVVEFANCVKNGAPVSLSEQQIVDCDFPDRECGGGSYHEYWKSLIKAGGQATSAAYPYISGETKKRGPACLNKPKGAKLAARNPIVALKERDENGVMKLLSQRKLVAVCIEVTDKFMNYKTGVYTTPCKGDEGLHAVAAVGYGTYRNIKYWAIRNSWSADYGNKGYVLFQRGINLCGVERDLATVNVA
ncbi:uncharacterized protein LOC130703662 [Daphnia carinata]|uniref:uncharacterized protein LOC130703662 n=1 Tax=Daphnia carinata TaxID=120202 RepID=UPI002580DB7D|nr:uncharacterized protein LOC130703662 [Daphnia carinata]XP_057381083.1 uncharacterized protein LOC130703662 [Daphnia carinata]XP_057381084.1 uncharacterized protein LOC130703662 [Daphnia carinata]XP_057381085.1 uncharacterized protein LOC130703662 [Daphnia carinata]